MSTTQPIDGEPARPPLRTRIAHRLRYSVEPYVIGAIAIVGILFLIFWKMVLVPIPPGHVGVLYSLFGGGTVMNHVLPEGLALKWPWNRIYVFDVRLQVMPLNIEALSAEGLRVSLNAAVVYRVDPSSADALLKQLGVDYAKNIVTPLAEGEIRRIVATHDTHRLYSHDTEVMAQEVLNGLRATFRNSLVEFYGLVFPTIKLPDAMVQAIEAKLKQEQIAASYEFILSSTRSEAERRRVEALGLHNYYTIVGESLSRDVLTWAGIQGTIELSKSQNSKVVVIGSGQNQMPIILGSDITNGAATAPQPGILDPSSRPLSIPPGDNVKPPDPTDPAKSIAIPGNARLTPLPPPPAVTPPPPLPLGRDMLRTKP
jgi:prohibitin 2